MFWHVTSLLGLPRAASDLREQQIDTEWSVLVFQVGLYLCDLLAEHVWCVSHATDDSETACVGDCCGELGPSCYVHASQKNWVLDVEEVGDRCADFLWDSSSASQVSSWEHCETYVVKPS